MGTNTPHSVYTTVSVEQAFSIECVTEFCDKFRLQATIYLCNLSDLKMPTMKRLDCTIISFVYENSANYNADFTTARILTVAVVWLIFVLSSVVGRWWFV